MALNKPFIDKLAQLREAPVYRILGPEGIGMFEWAGEDCKQNFSSLKEIDDLMITIDFLKEERYITQESKDGHRVPDLADTIRLSNVADINHLDFTQELFNGYYNQVLKIKLSLLGFIKDGYETNAHRKERRAYWLPFQVAILAAFLTALLTVIFQWLMKVFF
jgi:hypothetical protein